MNNIAKSWFAFLATCCALGRHVGLVGVISALAWGAVAHANEVAVQDDRGVRVRFAAPPQRIVSLLPSLSETVCALGHCARLVGVDRYSNYPATLTQLPQVGGGIDPNLEAILALRPDLVLMATSARAGLRLESLGVRVLALEPRSSADVARVIDVLGTVLGEPKAGQLWHSMASEVAQVAADLPPSARGLRVYVEAGAGLYAAGQSSFVGELLGQLGARNIIAADLGPYPKINPEWVVQANPQVIVASVRESQGLGQRPGWGGIDAVKNGRICWTDPTQGDALARAGPRMAEAARFLAACLAGGRGAGARSAGLARGASAAAARVAPRR